MTKMMKRCAAWTACLSLVLSLCNIGCQPAANPTTARNSTTKSTEKQPDNKKSPEPKADPG